MRLGLVVVGDEILSGQRQDKHIPYVIETLNARGLSLDWVRIVGDDPALLRETFQQTLLATEKNNDIVFSVGGIGATPDDMTRQALAAAAQVPIVAHAEGIAILTSVVGELSAVQQRLVEFPAGASLIPNPINRVPGFSFRRHYCMPGFPTMAWPMLEWVLDQLNLPIAAATLRIAYKVQRTPESRLTPIMETVLAAYPQVKLYSLPESDLQKREIELGVKGAANVAQTAADALETLLRAADIQFQRL
ncbi:MAG: competence/damage-inducible protein A [Gammaproteobacteria bacterium]|nr:competence/damage-inducible protein A [Gammaproteobacteria bacterium]